MISDIYSSAFSGSVSSDCFLVLRSFPSSLPLLLLWWPWTLSLKSCFLIVKKVWLLSRVLLRKRRPWLQNQDTCKSIAWICFRLERWFVCRRMLYSPSSNEWCRISDTSWADRLLWANDESRAPKTLTTFFLGHLWGERLAKESVSERCFNASNWP